MSALIDEAVCIRQWDFSETSQTVSLFTRSLGLVKALAKGARRPKAPYSGGIEVLTIGMAGIIIRPNSDLALLTEWNLREPLTHFRRSLNSHHAGLYVVDLAHHVVRDHDPHPKLHEALVESLRAMNSSERVPECLLRFQWASLVEAGFAPELHQHAVHAGPLAAARSYRFSPGLGGFVGDDESVAGGEPAPWRVRSSTLVLLRSIARSTAEDELEAESISPSQVERANRLLASYLRWILGREPRTLRSVFGTGLPT